MVGHTSQLAVPLIHAHQPASRPSAASKTKQDKPRTQTSLAISEPPTVPSKQRSSEFQFYLSLHHTVLLSQSTIVASAVVGSNITKCFFCSSAALSSNQMLPLHNPSDFDSPISKNSADPVGKAHEHSGAYQIAPPKSEPPIFVNINT